MNRNKPMQALIAIVMAMVVLAAQTLALTAAPLPVNVPHKNCHCGKACCVTKADTTSQPAPAVPTRTAQESQIQVSLLITSYLLLQPAPASVRVPVPAVVTASSTAPLYQRHCSYLI